VACHILLKRSWRGLQLFFKPHLNWRFTEEVIGLQSCKNPNFKNWDLGSKWHLGVGPMARHREYCKGEGGGFPQVWAVVSLVSLCLLVLHLCTKSVLIMHWPTCCFVCTCLCEWLTCLSLFLIPIMELQHALYPQSAMSWGARLNSFSFRCFTLGFAVDSIKESGGVSFVIHPLKFVNFFLTLNLRFGF
jgi:hypothetical protein